jgi:hypothetical protein
MGNQRPTGAPIDMKAAEALLPTAGEDTAELGETE